jgi:hypothetical protein
MEPVKAIVGRIARSTQRAFEGTVSSTVISAKE